jgi:hypothetical protein
LSHLCIKANILPRQARDKHRKSQKKSGVFRRAGSRIAYAGSYEIEFFTGGKTADATEKFTVPSTVGAKNASFLRHFILKMILLPRQARDKHRENSKKRCVLGSALHHPAAAQEQRTELNEGSSVKEALFESIGERERERERGAKPAGRPLAAGEETNSCWIQFSLFSCSLLVAVSHRE